MNTLLRYSRSWQLAGTACNPVPLPRVTEVALVRGQRVFSSERRDKRLLPSRGDRYPSPRAAIRRGSIRSIHIHKSESARSTSADPGAARSAAGEFRLRSISRADDGRVTIIKSSIFANG